MEKNKYIDKLWQNTLLIKREQKSSGQGFTLGNLTILNDGNTADFKGPYMDQVKKLSDRMHQRKKQTLILIDDDLNKARKTAMMFCYGRCGMSLEDDYDYDDDYLDEEDYLDVDDIDDMDEYDHFSVRHIDFSIVPENKDNPINRYLPMSDYAMALNENNYPIIVEGLQPMMELQQKEAIAILKAKTIIVLATPAMEHSKIIEDLIFQFGYTKIVLDKTPDGYYKSIFNRLIDDSTSNDDRRIGYHSLYMELKNRRQEALDEETMAFALSDYDEDLKRNGFKKPTPASEKLKSLIGLEKVKEMIDEQLALTVEMNRNPCLTSMARHMVFTGNPGNGKTTVGCLLSDIFKENDAGSGIFVVAERKDIIGCYVGHTAPIIGRLFKKARGGILFVDEAGFFLQSKTGDYVKEAIKEFVRYMEMYQDVTVIFALYPRECEEFLKLDEGLSSRIARIVKFPDYTTDELTKIFSKMAKDNGYKVSQSANPVIAKYATDKKRVANECFGNAREMRKLLNGAIVSLSMRNMSGKKSDTITKEDVIFATKRLTEIVRSTRSFGFNVQNATSSKNGNICANAAI